MGNRYFKRYNIKESTELIVFASVLPNYQQHNIVAVMQSLISIRDSVCLYVLYNMFVHDNTWNCVCFKRQY